MLTPRSEVDAWLSAIQQLEPPKPAVREISRPDQLALRTPATLAAHLWDRYQVRDHTNLLAETIARAEAKVNAKVAGPRIIIDMPPQSGKTESAVIWAAFWWLCRNPTKKLMIISYGIDLAMERGERIRNLVRDYGARYGLFLDPASKAKHRWKVTTGGALRCFGIKTGITGNPGDAVWVDDPIKSRAEAESIAYRNAVHNAYSGDILSRLAPGAPIIIIATRWHEDDLSGRRIREDGTTAKGGRWEHIHLPAICDSADDPLGRKPGQPLPHPSDEIEPEDTESLLRHWHEKRSGSTARDWAALYQGDPRPTEGALLTWEMMRQRRCYELGNTGCAQPERIAVAIDPSGGGRDTAGIIGGYLGDDGRGYLTHDRSGVMSSDMWGRKACELAAEIDADCFVIETNFGGDQATLVLRTAWEALRRENPTRYSVFCPRVIEVRAKRGKYLRAEPIAQQFIEDRARFGAYLVDVEGEWGTFQPDSKESPGRIDASVYLLYELLPVPESGEATFTDARQGMMDLTQGLTPGDVGLVR